MSEIIETWGNTFEYIIDLEIEFSQKQKEKATEEKVNTFLEIYDNKELEEKQVSLYNSLYKILKNSDYYVKEAYPSCILLDVNNKYIYITTSFIYTHELGKKPKRIYTYLMYNKVTAKKVDTGDTKLDTLLNKYIVNQAKLVNDLEKELKAEKVSSTKKRREICIML